MKPICNWGSIVLAVFLITNSVNGLYEDQIKKFDWRKQHIGALNEAHLELNSFQPRLLVSTNENVIASINPKTGEQLWRQIFESGTRGNIKLVHVTPADGSESSNTAAARTNSNLGFDMLTVQGHAPALIRGWNSYTGNIEWEWSLMPIQLDRAESSFWLYSKAELYHILPTWTSHLEVTSYFAATGQATGSTSKITAPWINADKCVLSGIYYICVDGNKLVSLDLTSSVPQVLSKSLQSVPKNKIKAINGVNGVVIIDKALISVTDEFTPCSSLQSNTYAVGKISNKRVVATANVIDNILKIEAYDINNCQKLDDLSLSMPYLGNYGEPSLKTFDCKLKKNNNGKGCLYILGTEDDAILAVQQNKLRWFREEALANIIASEFIDLPLSDSEGTLENELKGKAGGVASAFMRRITTQAMQIKSIFLHVIGLGPAPSDTQKAGLVRDSFGLHKMLVVLTRSGKIFGIDNINGKVHWNLYLNNAMSFDNDESMRLVIQRTSKHFPLQPLCAIIAKDKFTGNGILYRFNPITGKTFKGGLEKLNYKIKQFTLLAEMETDFIKAILLIDHNNKVNVYPENAKKMADGLYFFTADKVTSILNGFHISYKNNVLSTFDTWKVHLGGHDGDNKIIAVSSKNLHERVHSQGRVLGDRSVLYKYINPNLVGVFTQANDPIHKFVINVYLIDVVSGDIIFSMTHRKVREPFHVVHSENWLVYSYYNDKVRRTEISTIELYEGAIQSNNTVWSSFNSIIMPLVERQSYVLPTVVETMRETITERGITNKHVLLGTSSGAIIEMPWVLLDPRRPITSTAQSREDGAIPYIPELPLSTENILNYNQTIARLKNIYTAPSGLESTCLVVATGLDIFVTRVAPSKTFDLLKEDFDYILIAIVLVVLTSGSWIVKYFSSRKLIKQAWK